MKINVQLGGVIFALLLISQNAVAYDSGLPKYDCGEPISNDFLDKILKGNRTADVAKRDACLQAVRDKESTLRENCKAAIRRRSSALQTLSFNTELLSHYATTEGGYSVSVAGSEAGSFFSLTCYTNKGLNVINIGK